MQIKDLLQTPFPEITQTFNQGFSDYALPINATEDYLSNRWEGGRVDYGFSAGGWLNNQLKAILVHGVDMCEGKKMAFDIATCVAPEARGNAFTQRAYDFLRPKFEAARIEEVRLEVLQGNDRAIKVYEKVGFEIFRDLRCFVGELKIVQPTDNQCIEFKRKDLFDFSKHRFFQNYTPAWEHLDTALLKKWDFHECYVLEEKGTIIAYTILAKADARIKQLYVHPEKRGEGLEQLLFWNLSQLYSKVKVINIDAKDEEMCQFLIDLGLDGSVNQYEMAWKISR